MVSKKCSLIKQDHVAWSGLFRLRFQSRAVTGIHPVKRIYHSEFSFSVALHTEIYVLTAWCSHWHLVWDLLVPCMNHFAEMQSSIVGKGCIVMSRSRRQKKCGAIQNICHWRVWWLRVTRFGQENRTKNSIILAATMVSCHFPCLQFLGWGAYYDLLDVKISAAWHKNALHTLLLSPSFIKTPFHTHKKRVHLREDRLFSCTNEIIFKGRAFGPFHFM